MSEWLIYISTGVVAGSLAGLFGVGGGLIIVPVLAWALMQQGVAELDVMHIAVGTSLLTIVITSISSIASHYRQGTINTLRVRQLTPWLVLGSVIGAVTAAQLSSHSLKLVVAVFAWVMAIRLWLPAPTTQSTQLTKPMFIKAYGVFTGVISAMVGIGGGTLVVPYLVMAGESMKKAVGTAASCGFPIALAGAVGFMVMGSQKVTIEQSWLIGYVHLKAFLGIIMASVLFAPLGARLAKHCPPRMLQWSFSILLMMVGSYLALS